MSNIQIRDVPDEVHRALVRKAERAGQSLQQYLMARLADIATTPSVDDVLDRVAAREKGSLTAEDSLEALHDERARR
jgi:antitoxin FitA